MSPTAGSGQEGGQGALGLLARVMGTERVGAAQAQSWVWDLGGSGPGWGTGSTYSRLRWMGNGHQSETAQWERSRDPVWTKWGGGWELWAGSHGLTSLAERIRKFPFHTQDVLSPWQ